MFLGVLVPPLGAVAGHPRERPLGRAALEVAQDGVRVVFVDRGDGERVWGHEATEDGWRPVGPVAVAGLWDRFPRRGRAAEWRGLAAGLPGVPIVNALAAVDLAADKWLTQVALARAGVLMPEATVDADAFAGFLNRVGVAFHKPRFGAYGVGILRFARGDSVPATAPGAGGPEPALLQAAVPPPSGWAGVAFRVLVQRDARGVWGCPGSVARRSQVDPVVNAARGAEVVPSDDVLDDGGAELHARSCEVAVRFCEAVPGEPVVELGLDWVLDDRGRTWLVEVNGRPMGRLEVVAEQEPDRFAAAHVASCARPLRALAGLVSGQWTPR